MSTDPKLPIADAETVGMSKQRLQRIGPIMQQYIDKQLVPGAVTLVARHGKVVHFDSFGHKHVDNKEAMAKDTIFRIASMTKPIVSLALLMLHEEGKCQLHDPIAQYLSVFSNMTVRKTDDHGNEQIVPAKRQINIRHLLTHTAGFAGEYRDRNQQEYLRIVDPYNRRGTINDFVNRLAQCPLNFEPGAEWDYSRATCVVGRLVEVISGQNLNDFLRQRIFAPLGMVDTHFFLPPEKLSRFSASYQPGPNKQILLEDPNTPDSFFTRQDSEFYIGSGGLLSTAADYFRFAEMLRCWGLIGGCAKTNERLVSRKTIELMLQNHIGDKYVWLMGPGHGFGLGLSQVLDQGAAHTIVSPGTYSWGGMYCTHWWIDPVEQLLGMVMTQVRPYYHLNIRYDMQVLAAQAIVD